MGKLPTPPGGHFWTDQIRVFFISFCSHPVIISTKLLEILIAGLRGFLRLRYHDKPPLLAAMFLIE